MSQEELSQGCSSDSGIVQTSGSSTQEDKAPVDVEVQQEKWIEKCLSAAKEFHQQESRKKKIDYVLNHLQSIGTIWIQSNAKKKKVVSHTTGELQCRIYPMGSFKLSVNFTDDDVEATFVAPRFIQRSEFFTEFRAVLQKLSNVEDLRTLHLGLLPQLKMTLFGIHVSLYFIKLLHPTIDTKDGVSSPLCKRNRRKLDTCDALGLKWILVWEEIVDSVPNVVVFTETLKFVRLWAHRKGLLHSHFGYLSDLSWSILAAKVCQLEPSISTAEQLIPEFFRLFTRWPWPKPVILATKDRRLATLPVFWRPSLTSQIGSVDQFYLMPIIMPGEFSLNSAYGVTITGASRVVQELQQASATLSEVQDNKQPWSSLLSLSKFFTFRHYLLVSVCRKPADDHQPFREECDLAQHAFASLVCRLDRHPALELVQPSQVLLEPKTPAPDKTSSDQLINSRRWLVGLQFRKAGSEPTTVDLSKEISGFPELVAKLARRPTCPDTINIVYCKRRDLVPYLSKPELASLKHTPCSGRPFLDVILRSTTGSSRGSASSISGSISYCDDWTDDLGPPPTPAGADSLAESSMTSSIIGLRKRSVSSTCQDDDEVFESPGVTPVKRLSTSYEEHNDQETLQSPSLGPAWLTEECRRASEQKTRCRAALIKNRTDEMAKEAYIRSEIELKRTIVQARVDWKETQDCGVVLSLVPSTSLERASSIPTPARRLSSSTSTGSLGEPAIEITSEMMNSFTDHEASASTITSNNCSAQNDVVAEKSNLSLIALDCKIVGVGNTQKSALGRVSLVDEIGRTVYDAFCRPSEPITDYRTRTSGIRAFHMKSAMAFHHVQEKVRNLIQDRIVIGHDLNTALSTLRLSHPPNCLRDTAHCLNLRTHVGLPLDKVDVGLTSLTSLLLDRNYQKADRCSIEDARSSMDLYKLIQAPWEANIALVDKRKFLIQTETACLATPEKKS